MPLLMPIPKENVQYDTGEGDEGTRVASAHDFLKNQDLQLLFAQRILILIKVKELRWDRLRRWLVIRVVVWLEVGVLECILDSNTFDRVESEQFFEEIESQIRCLWKHGFERNFLLERKRTDVFACTSRLDAVVVFHGWCAKDVQDESQLVVVWPK